MEKAKELKPYAITLDIMMPGLDGWQVIQQIKSDPETKSIPIIICSIVEERERGFSLGATDYLVKPILEEELVKAVKRLNLNGKKFVHDILVIDDDPNALRLVETALSGEKSYRVNFAEGGLQGLSVIQTQPPDAVILDLFMPDLDGFSLLENIRRDPMTKDIPVLVITGGDLTEEQKQRLAQFEQDMLKKELLTAEDLLDSLHSALKKFEKPPPNY